MAEPKYTHSFPRYDPTTLKGSETVLDKWPALANVEALARFGKGENDKFLRYAMLLGEGSGLHTAIPDYPERKREALRLAGVSDKDKRYSGAFNLTDAAVYELRFAWLRHFCSMELTEYSQLMERYYQNLHKVGEPIVIVDDAKETDVQRSFALASDLALGSETLRLRIQSLAQKLFYGDDDLRRLAAEKSKPKATAGSLEDLVLNRR